MARLLITLSAINLASISCTSLVHDLYVKLPLFLWVINPIRKLIPQNCYYNVHRLKV